MQCKTFSKHHAHSMIKHLRRGVCILDFVSGQGKKKGRRIGSEVDRGDKVRGSAYMVDKSVISRMGKNNLPTNTPIKQVCTNPIPFVLRTQPSTGFELLIWHVSF